MRDHDSTPAGEQSNDLPGRDAKLRLLEKAVETMQLGATIVDSDQRIIYTNAADAEMHGYTVEELIGQKSNIFAVPGNKHPITGNALRKMTSWQRETLNRRKDGTSFPVEVLSDVVTDEAGEPIGIVSMCRDLTAQKEAERALRESQERYTLAVQGAKDGIWDWDLTTGDFFTSPRWQQILSYEAEEIEGTPADWFERIHPQDIEHVRQAVDEHLTGTTPHFESEYRVQSPSGDYIWVLSRGLAVAGEDGPSRMAGSLSDITGRKVEDPLTHLPNRVLFIDRLSSALARCRRRYRQVGVLFLDLDRFKMINDSLGHAVGDQLLVQVSKLFTDCVRPEDTVARLGGDEFAFLIDDIAGVGQVVQLAERIQRALQSVQRVEDKEIFARASIGIAIGDGNNQAEELLQQADTAMYDAKSQGRGNFQIFDRELRDRAQEILSLETELRKALQQKSLSMAYQPIITPETRKIRGFEALVRWDHPERGMLAPADFIPIAESCGLIFELGRQVLRLSCEQLAQWQADFPGTEELKVHVNVSAKQFGYPGLLDHVREAIETSGIAPSSLEIEITESAFIDDLEEARRTLEALQQLGVSVWLDDFGTGYSSLSYIHHFPVNGLKIDRSFVAELSEKSNKELGLTRSIVNLALDLGISVVAEGVETETQAKCLRDLDCQLAQGFLYGHPVAPEEAGELLRTGKTHRPSSAVVSSDPAPKAPPHVSAPANRPDPLPQ